MINPRISAVWSTTKELEQFSCTPRVSEVYTKADIVPTKETLSGGETVNLDPKGGAKTETSAQQTEDGNVLQGAADVDAAGCVKFTRSNSEMDPNDIVRDNLGYSKVKKSSNNNNHKSDGSELLGQSPPPHPSLNASTVTETASYDYGRQ